MTAQTTQPQSPYINLLTDEQLLRMYRGNTKTPLEDELTHRYAVLLSKYEEIKATLSFFDLFPATLAEDLNDLFNIADEYEAIKEENRSLLNQVEDLEVDLLDLNARLLGGE